MSQRRGCPDALVKPPGPAPATPGRAVAALTGHLDIGDRHCSS
ncbi:MAG: hypothetical protein M0Z82_10640 [Actinomycetota bacterium]|nr:hypothetical protein [Actinomycetota bacterium]